MVMIVEGMSSALRLQRGKGSFMTVGLLTSCLDNVAIVAMVNAAALLGAKCSVAVVVKVHGRHVVHPYRLSISAGCG